ncbi:outer membrane efflux protein [Lucifera butyrica]|uniref:Outer membrane efflux protein n=1 Tax=Lucifera butyrica TaxID=1351585 RepID=A0A498R2V8_9FIRM|nr:TolC family protein [Lucifera butyrica]VBB05110.1 outer membrane efflux protein [Lucifera butyrica]
MIGQKGWGKFLFAVLAGGMILINSTYGLAAPLELSLADSIALALKNNPAVKMAQADETNANWAVSEAKAKFGPALTFTHIDARSEIEGLSLQSYLAGTSFYLPDITLGGASTSFDNRISVSVPLYSGGNLEGTLAQAKQKLTVAGLEVRKTEQQLKLDTTNAYFSVLQTRDLLQVSREGLDNLATHLETVRAQYDAGTVNRSDVLRSEVELINKKQDLMKAQNNYTQALDSLKNRLGLPLDSEIRVKGDLTYQKYMQSLEDCIHYALQHRSDVLQAHMQTDIAQSGVKVAKSNASPQVTVNGSNDWADNKFPGTKQSYWSISLSASFNLFDSGLTKAKVKEAESGVDKAQEQIRQTKDTAILEVTQAYLDLGVAESRIEASKNAVAKAQETCRINEVRYTEGVGTNLDVLDAQLALTRAQTDYHQALYDYNSSKARLEKAMGI